MDTTPPTGSMSRGVAQDFQILGGSYLFNGASGIVADGTRGRIQNTSIFDNSQSEPGWYGLTLRATYVSVDHNRIYNARKTIKQNGIIVESVSRNAQMRSNFLLTRPGTTTLYIAPGSSNIQNSDNIY